MCRTSPCKRGSVHEPSYSRPNHKTENIVGSEEERSRAVGGSELIHIGMMVKESWCSGMALTDCCNIFEFRPKRNAYELLSGSAHLFH